MKPVTSRAVVLTGTLWVACAFLQGCGRSNPPPPPDLLKTQREALEKAKGVDKTLQDAAASRDAQLEAQQK